MIESSSYIKTVWVVNLTHSSTVLYAIITRVAKTFDTMRNSVITCDSDTNEHNQGTNQQTCANNISLQRVFNGHRFHVRWLLFKCCWCRWLWTEVDWLMNIYVDSLLSSRLMCILWCRPLITQISLCWFQLRCLFPTFNINSKEHNR